MQPDHEWTEAEIQSYIGNRVQENVRLDYKASDSLQKTDSKKRELAKDVSAFANSDGGTIIYGVSEDQDTHLPIAIDAGYDPSDISHEWLEQVVNSNIQPRVQGVRIFAVHLTAAKAGRVIYVVDIPKSTTAHQSADKRYYKRYNFESVPMEHYEVLDVLNRSRGPSLRLRLSLEEDALEVQIKWPRQSESTLQDSHEVAVTVRCENTGQIALYSQFQLFISPDLREILPPRSSDFSSSFNIPDPPGTQDSASPYLKLQQKRVVPHNEPIFNGEVVHLGSLFFRVRGDARSFTARKRIFWTCIAPDMVNSHGGITVHKAASMLQLNELPSADVNQFFGLPPA